MRKKSGNLSYVPRKSQEKINLLIYIDYIKLFAKIEKELETLKSRENIQSRYRDEIWHEKCAVLVMKSGKRHLTEEMELPNQDKIKTLGEMKTFKCLGILEPDTIKHAEMKEK